MSYSDALPAGERFANLRFKRLFELLLVFYRSTSAINPSPYDEFVERSMRRARTPGAEHFVFNFSGYERGA